uniref:Uncharacterized protein n=1 Tax=Anguilla anguilla TaxID=7936 RepID=A0A0E9PVI3_ANGAN
METDMVKCAQMITFVFSALPSSFTYDQKMCQKQVKHKNRGN